MYLFLILYIGDQIEINLNEIHGPWSGDSLPFRVVRDQAANGKKGVRQFFSEQPPRPEYDGNDCICHILDRDFKLTLKNGPLAELFAKQHEVMAYLKKSTKAWKIVKDVQNEKLRENPNYFSERATSLGWNQDGSWIQIPISNKPLKPILSMLVRWWTDIDENVRFSLSSECYAEALPRIQRELRKKGKNQKAEKLEFDEREMTHLSRVASYLYPIKLSIQELEGTSFFVPYSFFNLLFLILF